MELKSQDIIEEVLLWNKEMPQLDWKLREKSWTFAYVIF